MKLFRVEYFIAGLINASSTDASRPANPLACMGQPCIDYEACQGTLCTCIRRFRCNLPAVSKRHKYATINR